MRRGEDDGAVGSVRQRLGVIRGKPEVVARGKFARRACVGLHAEHEAQALRFALHRLDEDAAPAAEADDGGVDHCGSIPASRTSLPHLAISLLMNSPSSSGVIGAGSRPMPARRAFTSGLARLAATTWCSFATTGRGVPAGATSPYPMRRS